MSTINKSVFQQFPELETERFYLTPFQVRSKKDIALIYRLRSEPLIMQYIDIEPFKQISEAVARIKNLRKYYKKGMSIAWAVRLKANREAIGYFTIWNIRFEHSRAEVGYSLIPEYWNQGVMAEVGRVVIQFAFDQMQVHSLDATIHPDNAASRALLTKFGFKQEGLRRQDYQFRDQFLDSAVFGLLKEDFKGM
jgi:[ribosomal protein S5]-alanine N-acetyltransferase